MGYTMPDVNLQIATEGDAVGFRLGRSLPSRSSFQIQPQGFHAAAVVRLPGSPRTSEKELSRRGGAVGGLSAVAGRHRPVAHAGSQYAVPRLSASGQAWFDQSHVRPSGPVG